MFTQKGASQQGFPLLFLLFFFSFLSIAVARSCSESRPGSCSPELGLEKLSGSSRQGVLWVACPDAADPAETAGRPACLLPARLRHPSAWP